MSREDLQELVQRRFQNLLERHAPVLGKAIQVQTLAGGGGLTPGWQRDLSAMAEELLVKCVEDVIPAIERELSNWLGKSVDFISISQAVLMEDIARETKSWIEAAQGGVAESDNNVRRSRIAAEIIRVQGDLQRRATSELRAMQLSEEARRAKAREQAQPLEIAAIDELKAMLAELIGLSNADDTALALRALDDRLAKTHAEVTYAADVLTEQQMTLFRPNLKRLKELGTMGTSLLLEAILGRVTAL